MSSPLRAAVVGAGAIGSMLDAGISDTPLTHAGGYAATGFTLAALFDTSADLDAQASKWGAAAYRDFDAMMREARPEVISFAVPASVRADLMLQALSYDCVKAVVAEKPLAESIEEAAAVIAAYKKRNIPLVVNYSRRFVFAWRLLVGSRAISATIKYAKGIKHNGTHAIDLCRMLFGECLEAVPLSGKNDHWDHDPTVTAFLRFERCPEVLLQGLDERSFTLFEVDVVGTDYRVIVDQDGRRIRRFSLQLDAGVPPGRRLVQTSEQDSGAAQAMANLMRHVRELCQGSTPLCSGEDAIASLKIAEQLSAAYQRK
ncbi:Gfo/Idh/MocA family oxidoreductase [Rhodoferax saidenbachensis]|uniref:Dehydrogenase n=1 Tax=Rhodoferax saidenbachensis TaxID=1484693 RepID=A0ABU1ZKF7_9BURK|nr:Gfo/Idh/MocA family oxidoreductase [Rhodoferax saidenbachensis]MDR7306035.1 putative dehydrogenase [Rhodoferax saidenbachensis]